MRRYVDPTVPWGELDRVRQEVPDDLLQPVAIAARLGHGGNVGRDRHALRFGGGPQRVERAANDLADVDARHVQDHLAVHDPRHVEDVLDQLFLCDGVVLNDAHGVLQTIGLELARFEQLRPAEHRVERRAQLVRQRGQEFILHAVDAFGLAARALFAPQQLRALGFSAAALSNCSLQPLVRPRELLGPLANPKVERVVRAPEVLGLAPERPRAPIQIDEHVDFRDEHVARHRLEDVVDGADRITLEGGRRAVRVGGDEDNRCVPVGRAAANQLCDAVPIDVGHRDVEQHQGNVLL